MPACCRSIAASSRSCSSGSCSRVAICTETLAAGINLPARSVVLPRIVKGPPGKKKLIDPSTAHQIFGRAGRPQFDKEGHVFALAHEDDVKIARWHEKYDQIPEDTKDPGLLKAKKALKKKKPTRRGERAVLERGPVQQARARPRRASSTAAARCPGGCWPTCSTPRPRSIIIRRLVGKRLMDPGRIEAGQRELDRMLMTLRRAGYVTLEPAAAEEAGSREQAAAEHGERPAAAASASSHFCFRLPAPRSRLRAPAPSPPAPPPYRPMLAHPTENISQAAAVPRHQSALRRVSGESVGHRRPQRADPGDGERVGVAALGGAISSACRKQDELPPGPLATLRLDPQLLQLGLATPEELAPTAEGGRGIRKPRRSYDAEQDEEPKWVLTLADKLRRLFDYEFRRRARPADLAGLGGGRVAANSAAISTSTSPAKTCKSRRAWSSATCCG